MRGKVSYEEDRSRIQAYADAGLAEVLSYKVIDTSSLPPAHSRGTIRVDVFTSFQSCLCHRQGDVRGGVVGGILSLIAVLTGAT